MLIDFSMKMPRFLYIRLFSFDNFRVTNVVEFAPLSMTDYSLELTH